MGLSTPAYVTVQPAFFEPEIIMPYAQASGAFDLIENGGPRVRLADGDLSVYMPRMDIRRRWKRNRRA